MFGLGLADEVLPGTMAVTAARGSILKKAFKAISR
jgi:hypothetical protein